MALRVLLADESSTIKKVFQLALQDFAVEVQPVNIGLDVLNVARRFQPDIIFADVLLQKKNGYEVSSELKRDEGLKSIPVVLMWSGFMELDDDKFQASQANGNLEKPFDVKTLRALIHDLVPKTKGQKLSGFLSFPKMPEFISDGSLKPADSNQKPARQPKIRTQPESPSGPSENAPSETAHVAAARKAGKSEEPSSEDWKMDDFDPIPAHPTAPEENFKSVPLPSVKEDSPRHSMDIDAEQFLKDDEEDKGWKRQDLNRFQINEDLASLESEDPVVYSPPVASEAFETTEIRTLDLGPEPQEDLEIEQPPEPAVPPLPALSEKQLEAIIRAQSKEIIEAVVWKVVPEIATNLIERELKRLLDERDQTKNY